MTTVDIDLFDDDDVAIIDTNGTKYAVGRDDAGYCSIIRVKEDLTDRGTYYAAEDANFVSFTPGDVADILDAWDM